MTNKHALRPQVESDILDLCAELARAAEAVKRRNLKARKEWKKCPACKNLIDPRQEQQ